MNIDRAKQLAADNGYTLKVNPVSRWDMDLFDMDRVNGTYVDTLAIAQIQDMEEDAFVEFYLER